MNPESLGVELNKPYAPTKFLIGNGVLPENSKAVIYGLFKSGKTTLMTYMGLSCATGTPLFGSSHYPVVKTRVLSLQLEMSHKASLEKYRRSVLSSLQDAKDNLYPWTEFWLKLDTHDGKVKLEQAVDAVRPDIVLIDPLYKCVSGSENTVEDLTKVFDNLDSVMAKYGFALVFSAQGRKTQVVQGKGRIDLGDEELRGSTAIGGWVDSIIGLRQVGGGNDNKRKLSLTLRHHPTTVAHTQIIDFDANTNLYQIT